MTDLFRNLYELSDYQLGASEVPEAFTIREVNFILDEDLRTQISFKIEHVLDLAPSNNSCVLTITKLDKKGFRVLLSINTLDNSFESELTDKKATDPYELVKATCREIKFQLKSWKKDRFADPELSPAQNLGA